MPRRSEMDKFVVVHGPLYIGHQVLCFALLSVGREPFCFSLKMGFQLQNLVIKRYMSYTQEGKWLFLERLRVEIVLKGLIGVVEEVELK